MNKQTQEALKALVIAFLSLIAGYITVGILKEFWEWLK